jgi:CelD/BcsL family acetyltransferase involved in cellulose biosynthesis
VLTVDFIDPIAAPEWAKFVAASPSSQAFHDPRWLDLLQTQYRYEISACCVRGADGIEAALPFALVKSRLTGNRLVSLPFSDSCPPLLAPDAAPEALATLGAAMAERASATGLDLTVHAPMPSLPGASLDEGFVRHELLLPEDPDEAERGFSASRRQRVRKARKTEMAVERGTDAGFLDEFYRLHLQTRRRLGVPTQPKAFIDRFAELFASGRGSVWVVREEGAPVAAAVFLSQGELATYKYSATDPDSIRRGPNNLLMAEAIRWHCEHGFKRLDFGRTEIENKGLREFKRSWGAEELPLSYTYLSRSSPQARTAPSLRERVMSTTIKRSPAFVGRLAGEVLYRHAG